jgi:hypothetical protein
MWSGEGWGGKLTASSGGGTRRSSNPLRWGSLTVKCGGNQMLRPCNGAKSHCGPSQNLKIKTIRKEIKTNPFETLNRMAWTHPEKVAC